MAGSNGSDLLKHSVVSHQLGGVREFNVVTLVRYCSHDELQLLAMRDEFDRVASPALGSTLANSPGCQGPGA
jgi:hypothetical protein